MSVLAGLCVARDVEWLLLFFFFNDTATTEIYTLSLHDALPILGNLFNKLDICKASKYSKLENCNSH